MPHTETELIADEQLLVSACYANSDFPIATYDDGFGPLWISRNSIGINGIVRAQTWEDAYSICEDEFFPEADESMEDIIREYGFKRESHKVVKDPAVTSSTPHLAVGERIAVWPDDYQDGELRLEFVRWITIETPNPNAWSENELFCEAFGFRPNGANSRDTHNHGIYQKDLNGDSLNRLTPSMIEDLRIVLKIEEWN